MRLDERGRGDRFVAAVGHTEHGRLELELPGPGLVEELVLRKVDLDTFLDAIAKAQAALERGSS